MPAAVELGDRRLGVGARLGRQARGQQDLAAVHEQQRQRHAVRAVLGLDAVVPAQRGGTSPRRAATQPRLWRTWVAASAWPIDSWSASARRKSASAALSAPR